MGGESSKAICLEESHVCVYTSQTWPSPNIFRGGSRGRVQGVRTPHPPPRDDLPFSNTTGILQKKKTMWFIGVEVEQETSAPPPKKNPGSAPDLLSLEMTRRAG